MQLADNEFARIAAASTAFALLWTWESLSPFRPFAKGRRAIHSARNLILGGINAVMTASAFSGFTVAACVYAETQGMGILRWAAPPPLFAAACALIALDIWTYAWHRANHGISFLWRFHRVHHGDPSMDVSTAVRFHFGEIAVSNLLRLPLILLLGLPLGMLLLYDLLLRIATLFHHSNIELPERIDGLLRLLIVSPDMHKIHHSQKRAEMDSNYASVLSVWDRLFRTYRQRTEKAQLRYGAPGLDGETVQRLRGLLRTPLAPIHRSN